MNPTPEMAFPNLHDLAMAEAKAGTQQLMEQYKLQEFQQVSLDPHVGRLNFSDTVRFDIQVIGRYDPNVTTWQWAWADSTVPASTARAAAMLAASVRPTKLPSSRPISSRPRKRNAGAGRRLPHVSSNGPRFTGCRCKMDCLCFWPSGPFRKGLMLV
ncbi:MAG: hypothetical protein U0798_02650 [Gemmataceae bacterium]